LRRPHRLDLRLHDVLRHAVDVQLLGAIAGVIVPDRLVRGVADDADPHHPRHPTNKIPFLPSRASLPLLLTTLSIMAFGVWLPYSPLAPALALSHLPHGYWPILMVTLLCYMGLTQTIKVRLLSRHWIQA